MGDNMILGELIGKIREFWMLVFCDKKEITTMSTVDVYGEVDSVDFAIYLEKKALEKGKKPNVTQIQKWLYVCYGLYLFVDKKQLFTERPKAWDFGPVFPRTHSKQKKNGDTLQSLISSINTREFEKYDDLIEATLKLFGDWTASELVAWTHKEGSAWDKKYNIMDEKYSSMDNGDIILDFKRLVS